MKSSCWIVKRLLLGSVMLAASATTIAAPLDGECIVLLHGMVRTANSMKVLENGLTTAGYNVANVDYPSRKFDIESLASLAVDDGLARCGDAKRCTLLPTLSAVFWSGYLFVKSYRPTWAVW